MRARYRWYIVTVRCAWVAGRSAGLKDRVLPAEASVRMSPHYRLPLKIPSTRDKDKAEPMLPMPAVLPFNADLLSIIRVTTVNIYRMQVGRDVANFQLWIIQYSVWNIIIYLYVLYCLVIIDTSAALSIKVIST